jgi:hypothetical protein
LENYGVRSDAGAVSDCHATQNLCTRPNIDMFTENRYTGFRAARSDRDLLKYQTIFAYECIWMDYDTIRVD